MKKAVIIIVLIAAFLVSIAFIIHYLDKGKSPLINSSESSAINKGDPVIYTAHRGLSSVAPENTLPAINTAGLIGYTNCEFDIYPTKDGVWVLMHDNNLERMCGDKSGKTISEYTYDELMEFTINSGNNVDDFPDIKIPTLIEALDECKMFGMRPMIEIKGGSKEDVDKLFDLLKERDEIETAIVIAFDFTYLEQLRKLSEELELMFLISTIQEDTVAKCKPLDIGVAFDGRKNENLDKIQSIHDAKLTAAAWTIDTIELHDTLYERGVRYITTNCIVPSVLTNG